MRLLTYEGRTMSVRAWSRETGITEGNIQNRLALGWSVEKALTTPVRKAPKNKVSLYGQRKTLAEWARLCGMSDSTVRDRLKKGLSLEEALTTPTDREKATISPGETFGQWTVLGPSTRRSKNKYIDYLDCRCSCGRENPVQAHQLLAGKSTKCLRCAAECRARKGRRHLKHTGVAMPIGAQPQPTRSLGEDYNPAIHSYYLVKDLQNKLYLLDWEAYKHEKTRAFVRVILKLSKAEKGYLNTGIPIPGSLGLC